MACLPRCISGSSTGWHIGFFDPSFDTSTVIDSEYARLKCDGIQDVCNWKRLFVIVELCTTPGATGPHTYITANALYIYAMSFQCILTLTQFDHERANL